MTLDEALNNISKAPIKNIDRTALPRRVFWEIDIGSKDTAEISKANVHGDANSSF